MSQVTDEKPPEHLYEEDELQELLVSTAQFLASLSETSESPSGYDLANDPFTPDEVDFGTSSWLLRIAQVQPWLQLEANLSFNDVKEDPAAAVTLLFQSIHNSEVGQLFSVDSNAIQLTAMGADLLNSRLEIADKFKSLFIEALDSKNRKEATCDWEEAWDEEDLGQIEPAPIQAKAATWRVNDFAGKAAAGRLNLKPSYQRGDVWPTSDAQKLIESVLRGIPIPSIIIIRPSSENATFEVVDGKQRLTALLRFIGKHPDALARVEIAHRNHPEANFEQCFQQDYRKFRKLWKRYQGEPLTASLEKEYYFPFPLRKVSSIFRGDLEPLSGKYYCEIQDEEIRVGDTKDPLSEIFQGTGNYDIPVIIYTDATPKQIHEVFHLYNKQGKHLNAEEIRNAVYHDIDLARLFLVAAGDNPNIQELVPFIDESRYPKLSAISEMLSGYRFGTFRYKRTKLIGWLTSVLFSPAIEDDSLVIRSTAKHIDVLLDLIRDSNTPHPLREELQLKRLVDDLYTCIDVHSGFDGWAPRFKDDNAGTKWQELQLVASLVGVFLISIATDSPAELLDLHRTAIAEFTNKNLRPRKTQNRDQWAYIGRVALGLIGVVGVSEDTIGEKLNARYSVSCLPALRMAAALLCDPRA